MSLYFIIVLYQVRRTCIFIDLYFQKHFLNDAFPRRIFNDLAQMCQRDDVLAAYDNAVESSCAIARHSICVRRMKLANDRVALFASEAPLHTRRGKISPCVSNSRAC